MEKKMAQALIDIHNTLPCCLEEECAKQEMHAGDLCSNLLVAIWEILHRFKDGALEAVISQPVNAGESKHRAA